MLDVIVGHLSAAVEPLIDDDRFLVRLWEEVSLEIFISRSCRVGYVDIRDPALSPLVDLAEVPLDPGAVAQRASSAIGSTMTVRAPELSALVPTLSSTRLPAVTSKDR